VTKTSEYLAGNGLPRADLEAVWKIISSARTVLVLTHANPDADAVASSLALTDILFRSGGVAIPVLEDRVLPESLEYLPGVQYLASPEGLGITTVDLVVIVDCADLMRLGRLYELHPDWFSGAIPIVNIDHHVTNAHYGAVNLVDPSAAATCEVLSVLFLSLGLEITTDVATCLLSGIYGDTLGLRTPSTTSRTFRVVAALLERHADLGTVVDYLFRLKPFSTVKLWAQALDRAEQLGGIVWTEITPEMLAASGAVPSEGEGIVNFLSGTMGAKVAILFYLQPDGWRVSLRSIAEGIDVAELARLYFGGGHNRAAGCRLQPGIATRDAFLHDIAERIRTLDQEPVSP
jgi:bifunctional oligoribonuclease and PAP phosphatase NrnA